MDESKQTMTSCPICSDLFVDGGKSTPRILPCAHTACESCIEKSRKRNCVPCGLCGKRYRTIQGAKSFPINEYILLRLNNSGRREDQRTEQVVKNEIVPVEVKIGAEPVVVDGGMQSPVVENAMQVKNEPERDVMGNEWINCPLCNGPFVQNGKCTPRLLPCGHTACEACIGKSRKRNCISCGQCGKRHRTVGGVKSFPDNGYRLMASGQREERGMQQAVKIEIMPFEVKKEVEQIVAENEMQICVMENAVQVKNEPQSDDMETEIQQDSVQNDMRPVENGIQVKNKVQLGTVSPVVQELETKPVVMVEEDDIIVLERGRVNSRLRPREFKQCLQHARDLSLHCKNTTCAKDICQLCLLESHKSHDVINILQGRSKQEKNETQANVLENGIQQESIQNEIRPAVENTILVKNEVQSNVLIPVAPVVTKEQDDDVIVLACICIRDHNGIVKPKNIKINDVQVSVFDLDKHYSIFPCMKSSKDECDDIEDEEHYLPDLPSV